MVGMDTLQHVHFTTTNTRMLSHLRRTLLHRKPNPLVPPQHHVLAPIASTTVRFMAGGKREKPLHSKFMHPKSKRKMILKHCDRLFGLTDTSPAFQDPQRVAKVEAAIEEEKPKFRKEWVSLDTLLFSHVFRGWTKEKVLVEAFAGSMGRYEMKQVERPPHHRKAGTNLIVVRVDRDHPYYTNPEYYQAAQRNNGRERGLSKSQGGRHGNGGRRNSRDGRRREVNNRYDSSPEERRQRGFNDDDDDENWGFEKPPQSTAAMRRKREAREQQQERPRRRSPPRRSRQNFV